VLVKVASTAVVSQLLGSHTIRPSPPLTRMGDGRVCAPIATLRIPVRAKLGSGRCKQPGGASCPNGAAGRNGYPSVLTAKTWGFYDVSFKDRNSSSSGLRSYVMENVLFKISYPAEFHAQTAVEAAMAVHAHLGRWQDRCGHSKHHHSHARSLPAHYRQKGPLANPATATTACNT